MAFSLSFDLENQTFWTFVLACYLLPTWFSSFRATPLFMTLWGISCHFQSPAVIDCHEAIWLLSSWRPLLVWISALPLGQQEQTSCLRKVFSPETPGNTGAIAAPLQDLPVFSTCCSFEAMKNLHYHFMVLPQLEHFWKSFPTPSLLYLRNSPSPLLSHIFFFFYCLGVGNW